MDSAGRERLAARVLDFSRASQTEISVFDGASELTRFTHGFVHQNVAERNTTVTVRAIVDGRTGVASGNELDDAALAALVRRAGEMAKLAPRDPDQPALPGRASTAAPAGAYVAATAAAPPQTRARMCAEIFEAAKASDYWCAGFASTAEEGITIVNSSGALASFDGTDARINVKMNAADSSGFAEALHADVAALDAAATAAAAVAKARDSADPREVEPGEWTVILEPAAFGELFEYLGGHFSAQSFDEGSSFLSDGLNRRYFGENVSVSDDYAHPLAPGMPFDYEGAPTQRLPIISAGVAENVVTDSYWAQKLGRANTGHALPAPNAYGPQALHLVVAPGRKPLTQMIAETKRGLLISRFWYIRTVDQKKAIVTGMTRDGTFLIENGEVVCGVRNMRFNQSIVAALQRCEFSNSLRRTGSYSYSLVVPAAKIETFAFTSGTSF